MGLAVDDAVRGGVSWLLGAQAESGEIPAYASSLMGDPQWEPDQLNFVTALTSLALAGVDLPDARAIRARVAGHLAGQREAAGLWRYWSREAALHDYTPPDADDTACCSMAVAGTPGGGDGRANVPLLLANRDAAGRFYTWFLLRPANRSLRLRRRLRDERSAGTRARRAELWANSEAEPDDVDAVVNANVIRYLGPQRAPSGAVEWVASVVESGREIEADKWYRSRTSLYRSVAAAGAAGVGRFRELGPLMIERIAEVPGPAALRNDLELADALRVVRLVDGPAATIEELAARLLERQRPDGSWERALCYFGGPQESFGWASEALATATAVGALHGLERRP